MQEELDVEVELSGGWCFWLKTSSISKVAPGTSSVGIILWTCPNEFPFFTDGRIVHEDRTDGEKPA
jgi:hypothetical protein